MPDPTKVKVGAGLLYVAPIGTTEPTNLTTPWSTVSANWAGIGYTEEGHEFSAEPNFEGIEVAEELIPIRWEQTNETDTLSFQAAEMTVTNIQRAMNGGTITTISGTVVRYEPPSISTVKTRLMIGWESNDAKERWVFRRCLQTGAVAIARRKAPQKALIPMSFNLELPGAGILPYTSIMDTA